MATTEIPKAPEGNEYYEIRSVPNKGYGCFALAPIARGTRILEDKPLLVVTEGHYLLRDIELVFEGLTDTQKSLYYTLHSGHGQDPRKWPSRIAEGVAPRERQRIQEQHDARTGKEPSLISIFQTNCMEVNQGAAVFPHASRFNHCCNPNACFSWNAAIKRETIHVMKDVAAGEEITLSYCDMIHDKPSRSYELKHYGFECDCPACAGDESDDTTFAHASAVRRFRLQDLDRETKFFRGARLEQGAAQADFITKMLQMAALHQLEGDFTPRLAGLFLDIALICEFRRDIKMAELVAARAVVIKKNCQGADFPNYARYAEVLLRMRSKMLSLGGR